MPLEPAATAPTSRARGYEIRPPGYQKRPRGGRTRPRGGRVHSRGDRFHSPGYEIRPRAYENRPPTYRFHPRGYQFDPLGYETRPRAYQNRPPTYRFHPRGYQNRPRGYGFHPRGGEIGNLADRFHHPLRPFGRATSVLRSLATERRDPAHTSSSRVPGPWNPANLPPNPVSAAGVPGNLVHARAGVPQVGSFATTRALRRLRTLAREGCPEGAAARRRLMRARTPALPFSPSSRGHGRKSASLAQKVYFDLPRAEPLNTGPPARFPVGFVVWSKAEIPRVVPKIFTFA